MRGPTAPRPARRGRRCQSGGCRRTEAGHGAGHGGAGGVGVVGRLEHDDLVAGLAQGQHGGGDGLGGADGDEDLVVGVSGRGRTRRAGARRRRGAARGCRGSAGTGCRRGGWPSAATSFSSSGPSVSGKPWPRLTESGGGGQLGHGGEDRRGERAQALGQLGGGAGGVGVSVPGSHRGRSYPAISGAYRLRRPCSPSPTSTCTAGWTGGAGPSTISPPSGRLDADVIVLEEAWTHRGRRRRARPKRRRGRSGYQVADPRSSARAGGSCPSRTRPTPGSPGHRGPTRTTRSTWTASARRPRAGRRSSVGRRPSGDRGASPCWCGRRCRSRRRGSCT